MTIYFYHKKTLLDAHVLTQKNRIPQKSFAAGPTQPGGRKKTTIRAKAKEPAPAATPAHRAKENSPGIYPWEQRQENKTSPGRDERTLRPAPFFRPYGAGNGWGPQYPPLKRWAILYRPCGTDPGSAKAKPGRDGRTPPACPRNSRSLLRPVRPGRGSADIGRRPGTSEAAVRGRFTASGQ